MTRHDEPHRVPTSCPFSHPPCVQAIKRGVVKGAQECLEEEDEDVKEVGVCGYQLGVRQVEGGRKSSCVAVGQDGG